MKRLNTDSHIESLTPAQTLRELLEVVDKPEGHLPTMKEMRSRTGRVSWSFTNAASSPIRSEGGTPYSASIPV